MGNKKTTDAEAEAVVILDFRWFQLALKRLHQNLWDRQLYYAKYFRKKQPFYYKYAYCELYKKLPTIKAL